MCARVCGRVPSRVDWALNSAGVASGIALATVLQALGLLQRWQALRERWFVHDSAGALSLLALWPLGLPAWLAQAAQALREHATQGWAARLASVLLLGAEPRHLLWAALGLGLDGSLTALEAWALRRGRAWGAWLVVGATAALLPVELFELWRSPHVSRAALLALNALICVYLARRARAESA